MNYYWFKLLIIFPVHFDLCKRKLLMTTKGVNSWVLWSLFITADCLLTTEITMLTTSACSSSSSYFSISSNTCTQCNANLGLLPDMTYLDVYGNPKSCTCAPGYIRVENNCEMVWPLFKKNSCVWNAVFKYHSFKNTSRLQESALILLARSVAPTKVRLYILALDNFKPTIIDILFNTIPLAIYKIWIC